MTDRPILFSGPMIRALLAGRKTQTRRVLKPQPASDWHTPFVTRFGVVGWTNGIGCAVDSKVPITHGDRLWVKETWSHTGTGVWTTQDALRALDGSVIYRADDDRPGVHWFPSIFMFKQFSRLTLTVTDMQVQRLQDISEDDAMAEGVDAVTLDDVPRQAARSRQSDFAALWNSINGPDAWAANPWVAAYTFDVHRCNIDRMTA